MRRFLALSLLTLLLAAGRVPAGDGNRLAYLQGCDPYYPSASFPKLITPQWIGEDGVEAVVILAIDDMRGHEPWEKFLRPILERLKKIDGRAPVSIMTCDINPQDPHLQKWLKEGLSLETHTVDHPCPFFKDGFAKARSTYERCIDKLFEVPHNHPVAFRMPCCDSMNTPSPRFYAEIFNKRTAKGHFLQIDSSVFNVFTPADRQLPRKAVLDAGGRERFTKYLPYDRSFVNTIENYPYPYVIDRLCWEFPCVTPSDWQAQHLHKPANPITLQDWKAALDCTVVKQGVFTMVFHPYGWSTPEQHIQLIDYAVGKYGKKVKFLTFREALERLNKNLLGGMPLRAPKMGEDNGVRLLDVNKDGYIDVVIGNEDLRQTRLWLPEEKRWKPLGFPARVVEPPGTTSRGVREAGHFGILRPNGYASFLDSRRGGANLLPVWHYSRSGWLQDEKMWVDPPKGWGPLSPPPAQATRQLLAQEDDGLRFLDFDGDGQCELVFGNSFEQGIYRWYPAERAWKSLPFKLPMNVLVVTRRGQDNGVRFRDIDGDGKLDLIWSNEKSYGLYLFKDMKTGWTKVLAGKAGDKNALPMIARKGQNMGAWFHSKSVWWGNENTVLLKDNVARRSYEDLLRDVQPGPRSPAASLKALHARPGFVVDQVVCEPLVQDPIAFAWGPDGKLWVVEMGDYPLGVDGKGKPGGRIKFLESSKHDGHYDKMTVFLDNLPFPTGVLPWRKGVLVTDAPYIFYAEDTDGDGKADKKEILYSGFVQGNQQHRVNTLAWGLDNWIYVANGDSGGVIKSHKTGKTVNISGRDLRIRPDTGDLETVTGQTQYGRSRDDWGNWFGGNNSDPVRHYVLDDHYQRRNPHYAGPLPRVQISVEPGTARVYPLSRTLPRFNDPGAANRFTSANSPIVYRDNLFGPFSNSTFVSEPVHNLVHREVITPRGVTFTSRRAPDEEHSEFLASSDNWCRPTMIQTGPDGALWMADMYRHVIEHPEWIPLDWQKKLDLRAGHDRGRIYRVYPEDRKPRRIPSLAGLDTEGLVLALESPNGWQRDMAQMLLLWRNDRSAVPLLEKMAAPAGRLRDRPAERAEKIAGSAALPLARLHALCTLDGLLPADRQQPASFLTVLRKALGDPHPGVRRHAVRIAEARLARAPQLGDALRRLVTDPDPHVRMQLAYTLGEWDDPRAGEALARLAVRDADDVYLTAAVMSSVKAQNLDYVLLGALKQGGDGKGAPPAAVVENLLRLANAFGKKEALGKLLTIVATPEKGGYAPWQYTALAGLLDTLDQRNSSLGQLAKEGDGQLKSAVKTLARLIQAARMRAADSTVDPAERARAVRLLGRDRGRREDDLKLLSGLLTPQTPAAVQAAAVATLGRLRVPDAPGLLLQGWKGYGPGLRSQVLDELLSRPAWTETLLDAVEKQQVLPFEVDAARRQRLLTSKAAKVRSRATRLFAGGINSDRQKVIDSYREVLSLPGDAKRGKVLFTKNCAVCHRLGGEGNDVGPDLSGLTDKSSQALLVAVLDPNRAVEARYVNYVATTRNGLTLTGVLTSETGNSITLVGPDGRSQVVLRTDLEELVSTGKSLMPEGLEKDLRPQDLADLFEYVRTALPRRQSQLLPRAENDTAMAALERNRSGERRQAAVRRR